MVSKEPMNTTFQLLGVVSDYGWLILFALLSLLQIPLAIAATLRSVRSGERSWVIAFWLGYTWLFPVLGPLAVLWATRRSAPAQWLCAPHLLTIRLQARPGFAVC